jgi:hypothetical protein
VLACEWRLVVWGTHCDWQSLQGHKLKLWCPASSRPLSSSSYVFPDFKKGGPNNQIKDMLKFLQDHNISLT